MPLTAFFLHCAAHQSGRWFNLKNESITISYYNRHRVCNSGTETVTVTDMQVHRSFWSVASSD